MADGLFIDGIEVGVEHALLETFSIQKTANGIDTLTVDVEALDNVSPVWRPALDMEVAYVENGVTEFGGIITGVREHEFAGLGEEIHEFVTEVSASDYSVLSTRRFIIGQSRPAESLADRLAFFVTYLSQYGVTLSVSQATGPTLPATTYTSVSVQGALNDVATLTAASGDPYSWKIDGDKILSATQATAAPFDLADGDTRLVGDIEVEEVRAEGYANKVIVVNTNLAMTVIPADFMADGVATSWQTEFEADAGYFPGEVQIDGVTYPIELAPGLGLFFYTWDPATHTLAQRGGDPPLTAGTTIHFLYGALVVPALGRVDEWTGDGSTVTFPLTADVITPRVTVVVDGSAEPIGAYPDPSWLLDTTVHPPTLTRTSAPSNGAAISYTYDGFVPATATAELPGLDPADVVEAVISVSSTTYLDTVAAAELATRSASQRTVRFATFETGLDVLQGMHVSSAKRNLDVDILISELTIRYELGQVPVGVGGALRREITGIASSVPKPNWRDVYKQWAQGGSGSSDGGGITAGITSPTIAPSSTVADLGDTATAGASSAYSRGDHKHALSILDADPTAPEDDTFWIRKNGASPDQSVALRFRIGGVTETLAEITR